MGSRGDVQPYVALGKGLAADGHSVRIVTFDPFRDLVEAHGLGFRPIPDPLAAWEGSLEWKRYQSPRGGAWSKLRTLRKLFQDARPHLTRNFDACVEGCRGSDVILSSFTGLPGPYVAEVLGASHFWALLQPCTPTREHPYFLSPWQASRNSLYNLATHQIAGAAFQWLFHPVVQSWHRGVAVAMPGKQGPSLYGFSPVLIHRPKDWGAGVHITGGWDLDTSTCWTPPERLVRRLAGWEEPVCLCHYGITGWRSPETGLDVLVDALRLSGRCGIIVSRLVKNVIEELSDSCLLIDAAPFEWLFPRVCLILHHGGAGTTATALRAGRPCIVLPSFFDQFFWATALNRLGVAPEPVDPKRVSAETLARVIREASRRTDYAANAKSCGDLMAREDGVSAAVDVLRRYLAESQ